MFSNPLHDPDDARHLSNQEHNVHSSHAFCLICNCARKHKQIACRYIQIHVKPHTYTQKLLFCKSDPDSSSFRTALLVSTPNTIYRSRLTACLILWILTPAYWFVLVKRLFINWFPRLRFCGRSINLEFTITIINKHRFARTYTVTHPSKHKASFL